MGNTSISKQESSTGRYHGLFVGIDKYASPSINELRCAERDAQALHALFADTLGDGGVLLRGVEATRSTLDQHFARLATTSPDDVVVLAFSGHGSETHELVTYDTDLADLTGTAFPLDLLLERFKAIPARRLICVLDCCFSGGLGAKVLQVDERPRGLKSTDALLSEIAGDGRLILTASAPDEEAWENHKIGHGFLTHYLLEALQGAKEVRKAGKVSVMRLLEYVAERVRKEVEQLGRSQQPTVRGTFEIELTWPIFKPGKTYARAFPKQIRVPVASEVKSLATRGFRPEIIDSWAESVSELNALQLEAINDYDVLDGEHLLVSAPTSSGKTMIGELAALRGVEGGKRAIFLLPMKALVNDKHQEFERKYAQAGIRTIRATGDYSDELPELRRGQYEICLMTYEKCAGLVLAQPHILDQVGTIVIDEVQMLADEGRGAGLEFLLTLIRMRRRHGAAPQLVALSAVIGDTHGLEEWLDGRLLRRTERPVPLDEGVLGPDGVLRYLDPDGVEHTEQYIRREYRGRSERQELIVPLVRRLVGEGKQVIVFREKRGEAPGTANYLAADLGLPPVDRALEALPTGDLSNSSEQLRAALERGTAFHTSDLSREERAVVEAELRDPHSALRVVAATTTLAMGINTAAEAVVIAGLDHPGREPRPYTVAEYKNMVGRAGRLGFSDRGASFTIAAKPAETHNYWARYVTSHPEDLESQFLDPGADPRGQVLQVIAGSAGFGSSAPVGMTAEEVVEFLEASFGAFQERSRSEGWSWSRQDLEQAVGDLERDELILRDEDDRLQLTDLGRLAGSSGHKVESTLRLVSVIRGRAPESLNDASLIALAQVTAELDRTWLPMHPKSMKEPQSWFGELERRRVSHTILGALRRYGADHRTGAMRAKRAVSCLLWMSDRTRQDIELTLTRHVRESTAAGPMSQVASRTADVLPLVCGVAELLHPDLDLGDRGSDLLLRLQVGLPAELVAMARLMQDRLTRAEYLRLGAAGFADIPAAAAAADDELSAALGGNTSQTLALRETLAAEVGEVREAEPSEQPHST